MGDGDCNSGHDLFFGDDGAGSVPARLVTWCFRRWYAVAFHGIFGIVVASTVVIVPSVYRGAGEIVLSALCCVGGFFLAFFLARLDRRIQAETSGMSI